MMEDCLLDKNSVYVWLFDTKDVNADAFLKEYGCYFSQKRLETIERCKNARARVLSVCAGVLLYKVLSEYGVKADDVNYGKNGKPFVKGRDNIYFNLSHSGRFVLLAVSGEEVGADIQKDVSDNGALVRKISKEGMPPNERLGFVWALKESYTKLLGVGILKEFSDITFYRKNDFIEVYDNGKKVAFAKEIPADREYSAVICMEQPFEISGIDLFSPVGQRE